MSNRKRAYDDYLDPIQIERRIRERDEFVANLFEPIFWEGPKWDLDWLVQDLIPIGYLVMLAGPPKSGKTCLATALAIAVANGLPFAGRPVHQGGVLWISAEESRRERQVLLQASSLVEPSTPLYSCYRRLSVTEEQTLDGIRDWVSQTGARLLVVDPLIACAGHSLTDSWAARKSLQELKVFAEANRLTVLVIHHQKRDQQSYRRARVADNAQLAATASMNIVLSHVSITSPLLRGEVGERSEPGEGSRSTLPTANCQPPTAKSRLVTLDCYGRGSFANRTIYLVSHGPLDFRPTQVEETTPLVENELLANTERAILEVLQKGPRGSAAIIEQSKLNDKSVRNAITNLRKKGRIKVIDIGKNKRIYALTKPPSEFEDDSKTQEQLWEQAREQTKESTITTHEGKR